MTKKHEFEHESLPGRVKYLESISQKCSLNYLGKRLKTGTDTKRLFTQATLLWWVASLKGRSEISKGSVVPGIFKLNLAVADGVQESRKELPRKSCISYLKL